MSFFFTFLKFTFIFLLLFLIQTTFPMSASFSRLRWQYLILSVLSLLFIIGTREYFYKTNSLPVFTICWGDLMKLFEQRVLPLLSSKNWRLFFTIKGRKASVIRIMTIFKQHSSRLCCGWLNLSKHENNLRCSCWMKPEP